MVQAEEIVDEFEPVKRGIYGGAIGYVGWNGRRSLPGEGVEHRHELLRVHRHAAHLDGPVQMGAGGAPGLANSAEALAAGQRVALGDVDLAQMAVHRHEPAAVVDDHRFAVEEEITDHGHHAGGRRPPALRGLATGSLGMWSSAVRDTAWHPR